MSRCEVADMHLQNIKRRRNDDDCEMDENSFENQSHGPHGNYTLNGGLKRIRTGGEMNEVSSSNSHKFYDATVAEIKRKYDQVLETQAADHKAAIDRKDAENRAALCHAEENYNKVTQELVKVQHDAHTVFEENRILKKAVAIQDHKLRDAHDHMNKQSEIIKRATVEIERLNMVNNMLRESLASMNGNMNGNGGYDGYDNMLHKPPPDVF